MITLERNRTTINHSVACANRALSRSVDELILAEPLTPSYLRRISVQSVLAAALPGERFSLRQAEMAIGAFRTVNARIDHALDRYSEDDLERVLEHVTRNTLGEIRFLSVRDTTLTDRHALCLYQSTGLTLTLQTWDIGKWSSWHDHSCSRLALHMIEGHVWEMRYEGGRINTFRRVAGDFYSGDPTAPHRVGNGRGISLHAYLPWLKSMTHFAQTSSGNLALRRGHPMKRI